MFSRWFYVQHRKDANQTNDHEKGTDPDDNTIPDVAVFSIAPKEVQVGSPVLNGFRTIEENGGFVNKAFVES